MLPQVNIIRAKNGDFLSFFENAGISGVLTSHGVWDELTVHLAKNIISSSKITPCILDIGSNMGTFAVPIAKHIQLSGGVIHCFEPQRIVYYQICGNIFLNRIENCYAHNVALSTLNGMNEIDILDYEKAWNIGAFSLIPNKNEQLHSGKKQMCTFAKLDDFCINTPITLIKLDVEGMEYDVLSGGMNRVAKDGYPPILFESLKDDPRSELVFKLLSSNGYKFIQYANEDWLAQHPDWDSELDIFINDGIINSTVIR
jgi:FkbM family methyltransferase